jgi:uncharacterized DUF497 family protein
MSRRKTIRTVVTLTVQQTVEAENEDDYVEKRDALIGELEDHDWVVDIEDETEA